MALGGGSNTLTDCIVKGSITNLSPKTSYAMAGVPLGAGATMTNCLYLGTNNAEGEGNYTFGAGSNPTLTNCYFLNRCGEGQGEFASSWRLESGEITHRLQGDRTEQVWGQTLGTDNIPLLTDEATKRVYEVKFTYNGEVKDMRYANSGQGISGGMPSFYIPSLAGEGYNPHHYYTLSFGGGFSASTPIDADRTVEITLTEQDCFTIATVDDWKELCNIVNNGEQNAIDVKMTQDIDLGTEIVMVASESSYEGTFDGQGHTLSFNWDAGSMIGIAPFYRVSHATIKNLRTQGQITANGSGLSGLVYAAGESTLSRCVSDVKLTGGNDKRPIEAAGLIGTTGALGGSDCTLIDCVVKGSITNRSPKTSIAMAGLSFGSYDTMTNCLYLGTNNAESDERNYTFGHFHTLTNCYYLNRCGERQGEQATKAQLESGEITHRLQGNRTEQVWGQTLGTDTIPLLTDEAAKRVYEVKFTYNGEVKVMRYANKGGHVVPPTVQELLGADYAPNISYALSFEGDFSASSTVTGDITVVANVVYKDISIATKEDWKKFSDIVAAGKTTVNAKMTKDVDLGSDIAKVGTSHNPYGGTFDGQNHVLTVNWDAGSVNDVAPFGRVNGVTIKNLRTEGSIRSDGYYLGGLIDESYGENTVTGCVSNVNFTSSNFGTGGLISYIGTDGRVTISDCLVTGDINATTDEGKKGMGGFVYANNGTCTMNNCLYAGTNNGNSNASRNGTFTTNTSTSATLTLNNCHYLTPCGKVQGEQATKAQLESGYMAFKLQGDRTDSCHWAQVLGEWPGLYREADKAKPNYVYYNKENNGWVCDDFRLTDGESLPIGLDFTAVNVTYERDLSIGKATLCLPYELSVQGFKAYTLSGGNKNEVHFKEVDDKLTAYTPYYITANGMPQLGGRNIEVNAYNGTALTTPAGKYSFVGTVTGVDNATAAAANAYILQNDGLFHKVTTEHPGATVPAYHAYVVCPKNLGAKELSIIIDGETTGIDGVTNGRADGPVYDLQGRRVADRLDDAARHRLPAGVYIVGGRKVVVK